MPYILAGKDTPGIVLSEQVQVAQTGCIVRICSYLHTAFGFEPLSLEAVPEEWRCRAPCDAWQAQVCGSAGTSIALIPQDTERLL